MIICKEGREEEEHCKRVSLSLYVGQIFVEPASLYITVLKAEVYYIRVQYSS